MIDRTNPKLSLTRQCRLLSISRSSFYYAGEADLSYEDDSATIELLQTTYVPVTPYENTG